MSDFILKIINYNDKYRDEIISLVLDIQNNEFKINLSLAEQSDLMNINESYIVGGGNFWIALNDDKVIGTVALMMKENNCAVLKKFFVKSEFRSKKIGFKLYNELLSYAKEKGVKHIILDTPSVARKSHKFYEKAGFKKVTKAELPVDYVYPDRNSYLYLLDI